MKKEVMKNEVMKKEATKAASRVGFAALLLGVLSAGSAASAQVLTDSVDAIAWGPAGGGGGFPLGVRTMRVATDASTQGITYYALFPAGSLFEAHWHSFDEYAVVLRGELVIELGGEAQRLAAGAYVEIGGKQVHSWRVPASKASGDPAEDVILLVRRAGPADFHFLE